MNYELLDFVFNTYLLTAITEIYICCIIFLDAIKSNTNVKQNLANHTRKYQTHLL